MRNITFTDITIRECDKTNFKLSFKEKVEIAKIMDRLHFSYIELNDLSDSKADLLLAKTIASTLKNSAISIPVGFSHDGIVRAWDALCKAKKPVLKVSVPVSAVQMEYVCKKKGPAVLEMITDLVTEAAKYCKDVEFSAVDATRAEFEQVTESIRRAIASGAKTITICDTAGIMLSEEIAEFIERLYESVPELKEVSLSVELSNELDMATSTAFAAVTAGAVNVKTTVTGVGFPNVATLVKLIDKKGEKLDISTDIIKTELQKSISSILKFVRHTENTIRHENVSIANPDDLLITYDINDDINTITDACVKIGYELSDEDAVNVYEAFKRVAVKKKNVSGRELEAIIASSALQVPPTYKLISYVINSGNVISATANVKLVKGETEMQGISVGDGPIDAAFKAIEQILGHHYELDDFQIQSVTEGREAMGEAVVKLRNAGTLYSGTGISTDIIGASIRAYINAVNKIVYTEE